MNAETLTAAAEKFNASNANIKANIKANISGRSCLFGRGCSFEPAFARMLAAGPRSRSTCSRAGARGEHRPPRPQAREHLPHEGRRGKPPRQAPRFRARQVLRADGRRLRSAAAGAADAGRRGLRDARLHEPGAGPRAGRRRSPRGPLGARLHHLRVPHRQDRVVDRAGRRDDVRPDRERADPAAERAPAGSSARVHPVVRQGAEPRHHQTLPDGARVRRRARHRLQPDAPGELPHRRRRPCVEPASARAAAARRRRSEGEDVAARHAAYTCDCCGPRTSAFVHLWTDNTRKGVGAELGKAAREFAALLPTGTKVTRNKLPEFYYGECHFPLSTHLRLTVALDAAEVAA